MWCKKYNKPQALITLTLGLGLSSSSCSETSEGTDSLSELASIPGRYSSAESSESDAITILLLFALVDCPY